MLGIFRWI